MNFIPAEVAAELARLPIGKSPVNLLREMASLDNEDAVHYASVGLAYVVAGFLTAFESPNDFNKWMANLPPAAKVYVEKAVAIAQHGRDNSQIQTSRRGDPLTGAIFTALIIAIVAPLAVKLISALFEHLAGKLDEDYKSSPLAQETAKGVEAAVNDYVSTAIASYLSGAPSKVQLAWSFVTGLTDGRDDSTPLYLGQPNKQKSYSFEVPSDLAAYLGIDRLIGSQTGTVHWRNSSPNPVAGNMIRRFEGDPFAKEYVLSRALYPRTIRSQWRRAMRSGFSPGSAFSILFTTMETLVFLPSIGSLFDVSGFAIMEQIEDLTGAKGIGDAVRNLKGRQVNLIQDGKIYQVDSQIVARYVAGDIDYHGFTTGIPAPPYQFKELVRDEIRPLVYGPDLVGGTKARTLNLPNGETHHFTKVITGLGVQKFGRLSGHAPGRHALRPTGGFFKPDTGGKYGVPFATATKRLPKGMDIKFLDRLSSKNALKDPFSHSGVVPVSEPFSTMRESSHIDGIGISLLEIAFAKEHPDMAQAKVTTEDLSKGRAKSAYADEVTFGGDKVVVDDIFEPPKPSSHSVISSAIRSRIIKAASSLGLEYISAGLEAPIPLTGAPSEHSVERLLTRAPVSGTEIGLRRMLGRHRDILADRITPRQLVDTMNEVPYKPAFDLDEALLLSKFDEVLEHDSFTGSPALETAERLRQGAHATRARVAASLTKLSTPRKLAAIGRAKGLIKAIPVARTFGGAGLLSKIALFAGKANLAMLTIGVVAELLDDAPFIPDSWKPWIDSVSIWNQTTRDILDFLLKILSITADAPIPPEESQRGIRIDLPPPPPGRVETVPTPDGSLSDSLTALIALGQFITENEVPYANPSKTIGR